MAGTRRLTKSTPCAMRIIRTHGGRTTSSAAIRMTGRCRWTISSGRSRATNGAFVFDTGFDAAMGEKRARQFLRSPSVGLKAIGVEPADVRDVILSHMHYDHCGNYDLFPHARYHLQDIEMAYCTGRCMCHAGLRGPFEEEDVVAIVRKLFAGRVVFHDGAEELAPGLRCTTSAATRKACRWCGCGRSAAGWCWRRMPATSTPTWRKAAHSRSCTATRTRWPAMQRCGSWPARRTRSFRVTIRWVLARYPAAKPGWRGSGARRSRGSSGR